MREALSGKRCPHLQAQDLKRGVGAKALRQRLDVLGLEGMHRERGEGAVCTQHAGEQQEGLDRVEGGGEVDLGRLDALLEAKLVAEANVAALVLQQRAADGGREKVKLAHVSVFTYVSVYSVVGGEGARRGGERR